MQVTLLDTIDDEFARSIQGWTDVRTEFEKFTRTPTLQLFVNAHANTIRLVGDADYHYNNLNQIYVPSQYPASSHAISFSQVETESFIFTIYSALDSLTQEVNLAYGFGIDESKVYVFHKHTSPETNCVRCMLTAQSDSLSNYFDSALNSSWFDFLRRLRNRLTHRRLLSTNTNIGGAGFYIEMPTDPNAVNFSQSPRSGKEINQYCVDTRARVATTLDESYKRLLRKVASI